MSTFGRSTNKPLTKPRQSSAKIDTGLNAKTKTLPPKPKSTSTLRRSDSTVTKQSLSSKTVPAPRTFITPTKPPNKSYNSKSYGITTNKPEPRVKRAISSSSFSSNTAVDSSDIDTDFDSDLRSSKGLRAIRGPQALRPNVQVNLTLPIACGICKQKVKGPVVCPNRHVFCDGCMQEWLKRRQSCPTCKISIAANSPCLPLVGADPEGIVNVENGVARLSISEPIEGRDRTAMRHTQLKMIMKDYDDEIFTLQRIVQELKEKCSKIQEREQNYLKEMRKNSYSNTPPVNDGIRKASSKAAPFDQLRIAKDEIVSLQVQIEDLQNENSQMKIEMAAIIEEAARLKNSVPEDPDLWPERSPSTRPPSVLSKLAGGPVPAIKLKLALAENSRMKARSSDLERENETLIASLGRSEEYIEMLQRKIRNIESMPELRSPAVQDLSTILSPLSLSSWKDDLAEIVYS
ncbi:hypothetical protein HK096_004503 [Nowakowskiella sp. JEL0078]|nr:hypothetical protein HK096_004503 [Nowakowskiella sp. JEL0078]